MERILLIAICRKNEAVYAKIILRDHGCVVIGWSTRFVPVLPFHGKRVRTKSTRWWGSSSAQRQALRRLADIKREETVFERIEEGPLSGK